MADSAPNKPAGTMHPEQVHYTTTFPILISGFTTGTDATSDTVTSTLTTALATAGRNNNTLSLAIPANDDSEGININKIIVIKDANGFPITDSSTGEDLEVYGVITQTTGVYTLSYYVTETDGTQTSATLDGVTIQFVVPYQAKWYNIPVDGLLGGSFQFVAQDISGGGNFVREIIDVTATNTLDDLTNIPKANTTVELTVNGKTEDELTNGMFTRSDAALTWVAANGYDLYTTARVIAYYQVS